MLTCLEREARQARQEADYYSAAAYRPMQTPDLVENLCIIAIRKEKSRDAARSRRGKENYEFYELAKMLPLPAAITSQLDKASIIRLTISYLRMRDFTTQGDPPWQTLREGPPPNTSVSVLQKDFKIPRRRSASAIANEVFEHNHGSHLLQSLDGFLFILNNDGRFLYISETVSIYLGLSQVELTGSSAFDYVHPGDHAELAEQLGMKLPPKSSNSSGEAASGSGGSGSGSTASTPTVSSPIPLQGMTMTMSANPRYERSFFLRLKSTLTKRGVHIKSSGYKVVQISGRLRPRMILTHTQRQPITIIGFVALAHALPSPTINEIRIECDLFVCKANMDLKIAFCDSRISQFMDFTASDVLGKSFYDFLHAEDIAAMRDSHADLITKGQVVTGYYKWLTKTGGYIWMQTSCTVTCSKNTNDRVVVCINYILSPVEYKNCVMDISQLPNRPTDDTSESSDTSESEAGSSSDTDNEDVEQKDSSNDSEDSEQGNHGNKRNKVTQNNKHGSRKGKKRAKGARSKSNKKRRYETRQCDAVADKKHTVITDESTVQSETAKDSDSLSVESPVTEGMNYNGTNITASDEPIRRQGQTRKTDDITDVDSCDSHVSSTGAVNGGGDITSMLDGANCCTDQTPCIPSPPFDSSLGVKSEHHETDFQLESWDNPPNREITPEQTTLIDTPDSPFTRNHSVMIHRNMSHSPVSQTTLGAQDIPKSPFRKTSSISSPSTGIPESVLTPPATETTKSGFILPPVSSLTASVSTMMQQQQQHPNLTPPTTLSPMELMKDTYQHSETATSLSAISSAHASLLQNAKQSVINIHPHVLTTDSVTTAYAGMAPYANYSKYTYSPYGGMNLATHPAYQGNHYTHMSAYGNYAHSQETPIDLTYGSGYGSVQIVRPEVLQNATKQSYLSGSKSPYSSFVDAREQVGKLKASSDIPGSGQQKV
ncbi:uncharacterized protein LOC100369556 [Saccoglossus kowalevskii]|uniref:Neuronal PAS domain-containing protein 3-like n=1 Tax=Saccoglossus kowalevskii TaxID=10224 RepID=A0ABM0LXA1_SACKO|nr:PREDICTED: neuronal PAS domain-containing protein 3-like [Saccoglossus kowalevskii]